jgi:peptide chain release factor 1
MIDIDSKLAAIENRYDEINHLMAEPETLSDPALLERYGREYSSMTEVVQTYRALQSTRAQIKGTEQMLQDSLEDELRDLARTEIIDLRQREEELLKQIQLEQYPDAMDDRNVIVTIRRRRRLSGHVRCRPLSYVHALCREQAMGCRADKCQSE